MKLLVFTLFVFLLPSTQSIDEFVEFKASNLIHLGKVSYYSNDNLTAGQIEKLLVKTKVNKSFPKFLADVEVRVSVKQPMPNEFSSGIIYKADLLINKEGRVTAVKVYGENETTRTAYILSKCLSRKYDKITGYKYGYDFIEHQTKSEASRLENKVYIEFGFAEIEE